MDFDLIINSFPKLLFASITTLKLLSVSLFIGLFIGLFFAILRIKNNIIHFQRYTIISSNIYNILWFWPGRINKRKFFVGYFKRTILVCSNSFCS